MASIWRHPKSPFWMGCFTDYKGMALRQLKRTTATGDKKLATRIADQYEQAAAGKVEIEDTRRFLEGIADRATRRTVGIVLDDLLRSVNGRGLESASLKAVSERWLVDSKTVVRASTFLKYQNVVRDFVSYADGRAEFDIGQFKREDVEAYRNHLARRQSAGTVNVKLKVLRAFFEDARQRYQLTRNPAKDVKSIRGKEDSTRRPFTMSELGKLLEVADGEWKGMILFGAFTGQRLGDIATLRWKHLNFEAWQLEFRTQKTDRKQIIPLAPALREYVLDELPSSDDREAFLFPRAGASLDRAANGLTVILSPQFHTLMVKAGLAEPRSHKAQNRKDGRSARRRTSELSFHSLRHTLTSLMKTAGVPESVVMDFVGHDSKAASANYTHVSDVSKMEAVAKLPGLADMLKAARN